MIRFPESTYLNKNVPKNAFYKHLDVNATIKRRFVEDVDKMVWTNKFTSDTINVAKGKNVLEITVFTMWMKVRTIPTDIITLIDKNLPRHTLFVLRYENEECAVVDYKEATQGNSGNAFHITKTYQTEWMPQEELSLDLKGTTMDSVYEGFVRQIAGSQLTSSTGSLNNDVKQSERIASLKKEIEKLRKKTFAELNPTKKFAMHKRLMELENSLKLIEHG